MVSRYRESVFVLLGRAVKILRQQGRSEEARTLLASVIASNSYPQAVALINEALTHVGIHQKIVLHDVVMTITEQKP